MSFHGTPEERILAEIVPLIERATDTIVERAVAKKRTISIIPGTIQEVNGLFADVEPDDTPGEYIQAIRLDEYQGVDGVISGKRARTLLIRIPPAGIYCLGTIPEPRIEEEDDENEGFFYAQTSDSARAAGALTDMTLTADLTGGYLYRISAQGLVTFGLVDLAVYALDLDQDGTSVGNFERYVNPHGQMGLNGWVDLPVRDNIEASVFTIRNASGSSSTITMNGTATRPRSMLIECKGPLRGLPSV